MESTTKTEVSATAFVPQTLVFRCTAKNLFTAQLSAGGAEDSISIQLQLVTAAGVPYSNGNVAVTCPVAQDTMVIGNYYSCAITETTAPAPACV